MNHDFGTTFELEDASSFPAGPEQRVERVERAGQRPAPGATMVATRHVAREAGMPQLLIGTSGWSYETWKNGFYAGLPQKEWLRHCSTRFTALEINATFYRLQEPELLARWRDETPERFVFAMKANRYLTHYRRLLEPEASIDMERERAESLGGKLGAVLWQLPKNFQRHDARLEGFLEALRRHWPTRHVLEFRHASWFVPEVAERLAAHGVAACISDAKDWPMWEQVTTDFAYVRLHGHTHTYHSGYSKRSLERWAHRVRAWMAQGRDVHVYFDNTDAGAAPRNAMALRALVTGARVHA
jgi:uncharacterized protein YecE (DUF72 family)